MATSSVTKNFIVNDPEVFEKIVRELYSVTPLIKKRKSTEDNTVNKGKELLKQYPFF